MLNAVHKRCVLFLLTVLLPVKTATADQTLLASIVLDRKQAYPGEQILVTFLISAPASAFSITHDLLTLSSEKSSDNKNALIPVKQHKFQTTENTLPWQHVETKFTLFAQDAGLLTLNPVTVRATLPVTANSGQQRNPKVEVTIPEQIVSILPAPTSVNTWFAAADVSMTSHWSSADGPTPAFTVGEPITRNISLEVKAQKPAAIPPLSMPSGNSMRVYPGVARLETSKHEYGLLGIRHETMTLLPVHAGEMTLPAATVDWWDINNQQWKQTTLPAETITVRDGPLSLPSGRSVDDHYRRIAVILGALCLLLLLCCLWLTFRLKQTVPEKSRTTTTNSRLTEKQCWQRLQKSLLQGEPATFRKALDNWLEMASPNQLPMNHSVKPQRLRRFRGALSLEPTLGEIVNRWEHTHYSTDAQSVSETMTLTNESRQQLQQSLVRLRKVLFTKTNHLKENKRSTRQVLYPLYRQAD